MRKPTWPHSSTVVLSIYFYLHLFDSSVYFLVVSEFRWKRRYDSPLQCYQKSLWCWKEWMHDLLTEAQWMQEASELPPCHSIALSRTSYDLVHLVIESYCDILVHGVTKSRTRLSDFTFTFHFHALEEEMATHSSVLAWRIPGTAGPGGLPSMGSHRVGHDWSDLAAAAAVTSFGSPLIDHLLLLVLEYLIISFFSSFM